MMTFSFRRTSIVVAACMCAAGVVKLARADEPPLIQGFPPKDIDTQLQYEQMLNQTPTRESLAASHEWMCSEPHPAGTAGDRRMIRKLTETFESLGLPVDQHVIHPYLATSIDAVVEMIHLPTASNDRRKQRETLSVLEREFDEDPFSDLPESVRGWNAYSGSGDVIGDFVYANYGTKQDFETLAELDVDVTGKIVIARYGRNYRGYKAKFAEDAGAAGLIIYTDPADSGYARGPVYPDGGYANDSYIQRGSIKTVPYPGDPLTPFEEATIDARRLKPEDVALPRIPVQPIGYGAAERILTSMKGRPLPRELREDWQGGLPCAYRLTNETTSRIRLRVQQERSIQETANVIATINGSTWTDEMIIVGCHFDAWTFGAGDPHAGSIVLYEIARSFARAAKNGHHPRRTIVFANWAAEEFGIIGSTEWVEANRDNLSKSAIAYVNLDMAAMGLNFGSSAAPLLKSIIASAAHNVEQPGEDMSVYQSWMQRSGASFGNLGGGSDHIGFYCHLGVPSCSLGASGSDGVSYHSGYDNLTWYRQVVGDDYESARMLTQIGNVLIARLANAPVTPFNPEQYAIDVRNHLDALVQRAEERGMAMNIDQLEAAIDHYERRAKQVMTNLEAAIMHNALPDAARRGIHDNLRTIERTWLSAEGLAERPWFRNLYAANDPDSGYAAWMLPGLRLAIERRDAAAAAYALHDLRAVIDQLTSRMNAIGKALPDRSASSIAQ